MAERLTKRPVGVTRIPDPTLDSRAGDVELTSIDLAGFTTDDVIAALDDRNLDTTGDDATLRARLTADITGA